MPALAPYLLLLLLADGGAAAEHAQLRSEYGARLEALAAKCEELGLPEQAARTRAWKLPAESDRLLAFLDRPAPAAEPADAPLLVRQWRAQFDRLRGAQAEALAELALRAEREGRAAEAYRLSWEALRESPEQEAARRRVGPRGERGRARASTLAHPEFRWPARRYWRLDTENFSVVTNHSAGAAEELGELLEDLHGVWRQLFLPVRPEGSRRKHRVVLFRDREEYVRALLPKERQIEITLGIYLDAPECSYFFGEPEQARGTILHEATHQLFREVLGTSPAAGRGGNMWIIEGVALYMESAVPGPNLWRLGGADADRLQFARYRALSEGFHLPLAELVQLGRDDLQRHENIRELYSEAAGLTHFLVHGREGAYREAVGRYLMEVYRLRDRPDTLAALCGAEYPELDRQYRDFLQVTDHDLARLAQPARQKNLALGHTAVTDAGLAHLAPCAELEWLDLTACRVTDRGLRHLLALRKLERLTLERTEVTDAGLADLAALPQLKELDLSHTAVTDRGLASLARFTHLESLWLTGTAVSDEGLAHLAGLKSLEYVDVTGARVTPEGWRRLTEQLPKLASP